MNHDDYTGECVEVCCRSSSTVSRFKVLKNRVKYWIFLNVWCRYMYRHVMVLMHKFDIHHAPPNFLQDDENGRIHHWCQWCGLRGTTWKRNNLDLINTEEL